MDRLLLIVNCDRMAPGHTLGVAHFAFALLAALRRTGRVRVLCVVTPDLADAYGQLTDIQDGVMVHGVGEPIDLSESPLVPEQGELVVEYSPHHFQRRVCPDAPAMVTCHDLHVFDIPWKYPQQQSVAELFSANMRSAAAILTHFPRTARDLPRFVQDLQTRIVLTPSPAMLDATRPSECELMQAKERFKITGQAPVLLYPAQLQQHKNHRNLFTALAHLNESVENGSPGQPEIAGPAGTTEPAMLICPGSEFKPFQTEQLRQHAASLGLSERVQMPGFVSDVELRCLYSLCDAVVMPSLAEGGAYIAYEAILFRKPVACSSLDSARMHLEMAGAQVPLFDPFDPRSISSALREVLGRGGTIIGQNEASRERILSWSFDMTAELYLNEAMSVAGQGLHSAL